MRLDSYLNDNGFHRNTNEPILYVKEKSDDILIVCIYMDDIISFSSSEVLSRRFKKGMTDEFEMTDLGLLHYFLGLQICQIDYDIFVSQEKYSLNLLNKFNMQNCKMFSTPLNTNAKFTIVDDTLGVNEKY